MYSINNHQDCINRICQNWLKSHELDLLNTTDFKQYDRILILSRDINELIQKVETVILHNRMLRQKNFFTLRTIISNYLKIEAENLALSTSFKNDLEIDSLEWQELLMIIEKTFYIKISHEAATSLTTVQHIVSFVTLIFQEKNHENA